MLEKLTAVSADINKNLYEFPTVYPRLLIMTIRDCVNMAIDAGETDVIDADFVKNTYKDEISQAKEYYKIIMADSGQKARFQEALATLNSATINWLAEAFGLL